MFYTPYSKIDDFFCPKRALESAWCGIAVPPLESFLTPVSGIFDQCGVVQYECLPAPPFETEFSSFRTAKIIFLPVP